MQKLAVTHTSDPKQLTRWGPDPIRSTSKEFSYVSVVHRVIGHCTLLFYSYMFVYYVDAKPKKNIMDFFIL